MVGSRPVPSSEGWLEEPGYVKRVLPRSGGVCPFNFHFSIFTFHFLPYYYNTLYRAVAYFNEVDACVGEGELALGCGFGGATDAPSDYVVDVDGLVVGSDDADDAAWEGGDVVVG